MTWFSGKVSLGNLDFAGAVNKLSVSVKNIKKNFDNVLGLKEKFDDAAASDTEDMRNNFVDVVQSKNGHYWDLQGSKISELMKLGNLEVKVPVWIDGKEVAEYVGVGARFGKSLESNEKHANQTRVSLADPPDCCSKPRNKLSVEIILVHRGNCSFVTKGNVAEDAGASALLII